MRQWLRSTRDSLLYRQRRRAVVRDWEERHGKIFKLHPEYANPAPSALERQHAEFWKPLAEQVDLSTFRVCYNIAGQADPRIIPEDVFAGIIERCITPPEWPRLFSHKSLYDRFYPSGIFPENYLHNLAGQFFSASFEPISSADALAKLNSFEYPVVLKPNTDSSGGKDVSFPASPGELRTAIAGRADFLVQRPIRQHPDLSAFNIHGLNTIRVYTYRPPGSEEVHFLNAAFRMGKGGSLDNETAGGIVTFVNPDGKLNPWAVDKYGGRFDKHPDTGLSFGPERSIPHFSAMVDLARFLGRRLPMVRLAGWDMCLEENGTWRCLETNLEGHTIRFAQYAGHAFFGDLTDEVLRQSLQNPLRRKAGIRLH